MHRFFWILSCPITVVSVRSQTLSGTFFLLLYQPLSINENPFDQCYQRLGFGLPAIPLSFIRYDS
jgi:hypothetical protein